MLWGAFNNASSAMMAMSTDMGSISQNIANVNTTGYKRSEMLFKTVMSEGHASPNSYVAGLNIFGVQATQRNLIQAQGIIMPSNTWSDLAINGRGFFMVAPPVANSAPETVNTASEGGVYYTRDGSWSRTYGPDTDPTLARNYFVTGGGNYLLGYMADDSGVIPSDATLQPVYTLGPRPIPGNGSSSVDDSSALTPTSQTMPGRVTTSASIRANLPSTATTSQKIPLQVYDENFYGHTVNLSFTRTGANTWTMSVLDDGNASGTTLTAPPSVDLTFDDKGQLLTPAGGSNLALSWTGTNAGSASFDLNLDQLTQYTDQSLYIGTVKQDGYARGNLMQTAFNEMGELRGYYDNGQGRVLFKLPVATFVSENNLAPISGNLFKRTAAAGDLTVDTIDKVPGEGRFATSSLEASTVSIEDEFTRMIMTQKAYSTNAQVFKTADEMTSAARDLKR